MDWQTCPSKTLLCLALGGVENPSDPACEGADHGCNRFSPQVCAEEPQGMTCMPPCARTLGSTCEHSTAVALTH